MVPQQYCLRWKHHHSNVQSMFAQLLEKERFCDVTLYCSPNFATQVPNKDTIDPQNIRGVSLRAHRVVLAACSELLGALLGAHEAHGEPVLVIDGAEPRHLRALLDYMYTGEMNVHHSQLAGLLKTAEELRIKGLTDIRWNNKDEPPDCTTGAVTTVAQTKTEPEKIIRQEKNAYDIKIQDVRSTGRKMKLIRDKDARDRDASDLDIKEEEENEKFNLNGGPPPLIKLSTKEKVNPIKREHSEPESQSPKRRRVTSGTENTDDENTQIKTERDQEWRHGNLPGTSKERRKSYSPPLKRPRSALSVSEKVMIVNVYKHVNREIANHLPAYERPNKNECVTRVAGILGIANRTVYSVLKEVRERVELMPPKKTGPKRMENITDGYIIIATTESDDEMDE